MARLKGLTPRIAPLRPRLAKADDARAELDRRRDLRPWRKWYHSTQWRKLRMQILLRDLFTCQRCGLIEGVTSNLVADHRKPHRGDAALFWDQNNLWTLCAPCHSSAKQREDRAAQA